VREKREKKKKERGRERVNYNLLNQVGKLYLFIFILFIFTCIEGTSNLILNIYLYLSQLFIYIYLKLIIRLNLSSIMPYLFNDIFIFISAYNLSRIDKIFLTKQKLSIVMIYDYYDYL